MKVNVITRHAPANYGSLLQTIATQKIISDLGYECEIIDYIPKYETGVRIAFTQLKQKKKWNNNLIKKLLYIAAREPENIIMYKKFSAMRKRTLNLGFRCCSIEELKETYRNETGSIYVTGSDQVWGSVSTGIYDPAYFLDFIPKDARRLSFSSSFGKTAFDAQTKEEYKQLLLKYDAVTVREDSAVELINTMGIHAEQILDPTLLLTSDEWEQYITPMRKPDRYVLVYQIHNNPGLDIYAKNFARYVDMPLVRISPLFHQAKRGGRFVYLPDIGGFLDLIKNADHMVTDSFHGTAFAINFNTRFVEVLPNTDTGSRNQSVLKLLDLTDRIVKEFDKFDLADKQIDFSSCRKKLETEREKSLNIVRGILSL